MNNTEPRAGSPLEYYMIYFSDEGIDFDRFVERGGWLVGREASADLAFGSAELREKIASLRPQHLQLARQLEFLADVFASDMAHVPNEVRNEIAFALLYAVMDLDLIPDAIPEVGYLDDVAVTECVLSRHAEVFERCCVAHDIKWATLKPQIRN